MTRPTLQISNTRLTQVWDDLDIDSRMAILKHITSLRNLPEARLKDRAEKRVFQGGFAGSQIASIRFWIVKFGLHK